MFSINDINTAKTVSQEGSLRAAAQRLFKTQPAISQAIKRLEETIGFELFDRSGYRVSLTPKGKDFLYQTETLLAYELRLREYAAVLKKGQESSLQIVVWPMTAKQILIPTLTHINREFPETSINIDYVESMGAMDVLLNGQAEIAISPYAVSSQITQAVDSVIIDSMAFANVIAPALLGKNNPSSIPREQLTQWNRIILRNAISGKSYSFGAERGGRRWIVNDQRIMTNLIKEGLGWGLMPVPVVRQDIENGTLIAMDLPEFGSRMTTEIAISRLRERPIGPVAENFWETIIANSQRHQNTLTSN